MSRLSLRSLDKLRNRRLRKSALNLFPTERSLPARKNLRERFLMLTETFLKSVRKKRPTSNSNKGSSNNKLNSPHDSSNKSRDSNNKLNSPNNSSNKSRDSTNKSRLNNKSSNSNNNSNNNSSNNSSNNNNSSNCNSSTPKH